MTAPERHQKVSELFVEACKRKPEERAAFLDGACADDPTLKAEVETMLAADAKAPAFLEEPALAGHTLEPGMPSDRIG